MGDHTKLVGVLLTVTLSLMLAGSAAATGSRPFEVWTVDRSNSNGKQSGGTLYIYDGRRLEGRRAARARPERIDLGGAAEELCLEAIAPISNVDAQGIDRADPHALRVRLK